MYFHSKYNASASHFFFLQKQGIVETCYVELLYFLICICEVCNLVLPINTSSQTFSRQIVRKKKCFPAEMSMDRKRENRLVFLYIY